MPVPPSVSQVFGPILSASQIEEATEKTLRKWFPSYLAEMERQLGMRKGLLKHPQNYWTRNSFDAEAGETTPKIVVISPGLEELPLKNASSYRAQWRLNVGVATGAKTEEQCNLEVKAYAAAIRGIVVHKAGTLREFGVDSLESVEWTGETYDDLDIPNQHILYKAAMLSFTVDVNCVLARFGGPDEPDLAPPDFGEVEEVIIDLQKMPLGGY